ncbi:response regulator transcription factor [Sediminibacterium sp.]|uniref:response regulator transcription factor n=1 Tax=Sediminibacterium sp. TaxID=1917865 RepID=UPI0025D05422|nr:response regulator transcription factor [Sediminibacterium sp.]MBW0178992.1 response regulator transcription factor [Sediminibacterium sp.]
MDNQIRILIADDHELYLEGIKGFFSDNEMYHIVGEASNGEELVKKAKTLDPQIILTDLRMPLLEGSIAIEKIIQWNPSIKCVVLTNYENDVSIIEALEAGAIGYITKNMPKAELFTALDQVCKGYPYYCRTTNTKMIRLLGRSHFNPYKHKQSINFSELELKIIHMICHEKTNQEIAEMLFLSRRTIENNRALIYKKMQVRTSAGVAIYALKQGLFSFNE